MKKIEEAMCAAVKERRYLKSGNTELNVAKASARELAIDWQHEDSQRNISYGELADAGERFNKLGKRFGLLGEFMENGIQC